VSAYLAALFFCLLLFWNDCNTWQSFVNKEVVLEFVCYDLAARCVRYFKDWPFGLQNGL
jgi:hypothetical protein